VHMCMVETGWICVDVLRRRTTMTERAAGVSRSFLLIYLQLTLVISVTVAYYIHPSHLLKRKLGQ